MPTEDEIRKLRFPEAPAWGEAGPSTSSLAEDIARWYENAGGLGKAVQLAQSAGAQWNPDDLRRKMPVTFADTGKPSDLGTYDPNNGKILLQPRFQTEEMDRKGRFGRQMLVEHERSHGALGVPRQDEPLAKGAGAFDRPEFGDYVMRPSEMRVRLAQIKRRYAHATGKIVDSPEEANKALLWYMDNAPNEPSGPDKDDTGQGAAVEYLYNPDVRRKAMEMMPKVVNADMLIGRLNT